MIKVWDYAEEYKNLKKQILNEVNKVFTNGVLIFGPKLYEFEKKFSSYLNVKYGIGVGNGTDALYIALKALNIGIGDEVITTSNTAVPTVTAIVNSGAAVKFVDINQYYLINHELIEKKITKKTKAIIAVHLYGQSCDMDEINIIAKKHNLFVIEDCAQSHGAKYKNKFTGGLSDIGCFSFYPTKILGAYGDGGFITTNNKEIYDKMMRIRFLGMERKQMSSGHWNGKYYAIEHGTNSRLDEVQAAILLIKFKHLNKWISKRRRIARIYNQELCDLLEIPKVAKNNFHAHYLYVASHPERNWIIEELIKKNIHLNISYPWPIHTMKPYKKFVCSDCNCLPVTQEKAKTIFSLPMHAYLKDKDQEKVIKNIRKILK